jgi:hypothetical protein
MNSFAGDSLVQGSMQDLAVGDSAATCSAARAPWGHPRPEGAEVDSTGRPLGTPGGLAYSARRSRAKHWRNTLWRRYPDQYLYGALPLTCEEKAPGCPPGSHEAQAPRRRDGGNDLRRLLVGRRVDPIDDDRPEIRICGWLAEFTEGAQVLGVI